MPRVGAGQPTLDAATWQNVAEVIDAAFLELIIGASLPLQSATAAACEKFIVQTTITSRPWRRHVATASILGDLVFLKDKICSFCNFVI